MVEALPAVRAAQEDAGERGQDAPPDGGQARPGRWSAVAAVGSFFPRVAGAAGRRRRAGTGARGGAGRASSDPRVVQPRLFLELLMQLLAHPARPDRARQGLECRVGGKVGQVVLALAGQVLPACGDRTVGHARTRTAANAARSGPLDPIRHEMERNASGRASSNLAAASMWSRIGLKPKIDIAPDSQQTAKFEGAKFDVG